MPASGASIDWSRTARRELQCGENIFMNSGNYMRKIDIRLAE